MCQIDFLRVPFPYIIIVESKLRIYKCICKYMFLGFMILYDILTSFPNFMLVPEEMLYQKPRKVMYAPYL